MANRTPRISPERQDKIVELYAQGHSRLKVAELMDTTIVTVNKVLTSRGVPLRPAVERRFGEEDERRLAARYTGGARIADLAAEFGCTELTIRRALERGGVTRRDDRGRTRHFTEAEFATMAEMAAGGSSQSQIAAALNSATSTVQNAMAQRGLLPARRGMASGAAHGAWRGGRTLHPDGYVMVKVARDGPYGVMADRHGYVLEHRLAMALSLGRPLDTREQVHHINGIRTDNRISNLQLRSGAHGSGACYRCLDCGSTNVAAVKIAEIEEN
jgi:transposase-like protein